MSNEIVYTRHAIKRMKFRRIKKKDVEKVLRNPDVKDEQNGIKIYQAKIKSRLLRVFIKMDKNKYIVISAYFTTKVKKYQGGP